MFHRTSHAAATQTLVTARALSSPAIAADAAAGLRVREADLDFEAVYAEHARFVWRSLARLGVPEEQLADGLQDVFVVDQDGRVGVQWSSDPQAWNVALLKVEPTLYVKPVVLEVNYKVTAASREGRRPWGTTFTPPRFAGAVHVPRVRWQWTYPGSWFAVPVGAQARAEMRWGLIGWLIGPVPATTSAELEEWIGGHGPGQHPSRLERCSRPRS